MKVKGLRWMVIGLIMLITIINYLDRGTLNYMWVANIDYRLVSQTDALADKGNHAVLAGEQYILTAANGNRDSVSVANVQMKEKNGVTFVTNREGIAIDLGLIDRNDPDASQQAKDILGLITIFFMIAYGISQFVHCLKIFFYNTGSVALAAPGNRLAIHIVIVTGICHKFNNRMTCQTSIHKSFIFVASYSIKRQMIIFQKFSLIYFCAGTDIHPYKCIIVDIDRCFR